MKRTKYPIHPDFKKWENMNPPLNRAIVPAEMYNTKGTMHGFDIVLDSQIVRECVERRIAFLRRGFGNFIS